MRLWIGGPTRDAVPARFAFDLAELYARTRERGPWASVMVGYTAATYVHVGREYVLDAAIRLGATHMLWLDTDMTFPPDTAIRLAQHNRPIVACNCVMKTWRPVFTAVREGTRIETRPESTGLEAVDSVGMAVLLMRTDIMRGMTRPWFSHSLNANGDDIGEDIMCCRKIRQGGHEIYIDHDLSKEIGHIGQHTFRPDCGAALAV
jgi:hypothetical protein